MEHVSIMNMNIEIPHVQLSENQMQSWRNDLNAK